jgi:hypothetical protein
MCLGEVITQQMGEERKTLLLPSLSFMTVLVFLHQKVHYSFSIGSFAE